MTQALISRLSGLAETVEQIPVEFIQREKLASLASNAAQTLRDQLARIEALEAALKPFAEATVLSQSALIVAGDGITQAFDSGKKHVTIVMESDAGEAFNKARAALGDKA